MGGEGNDYTQEALLSGGRLQLFYKVWKENGCHPRVVHILKHGYEIILRDPIELARHPTIHSGYANQQKQNFLLECVQQMLQKKAVIPVRMSATLGFHSRLFLVPKPGKKWRPVIDLSVLNNHLTVPTFKMETAEVIRNSICKGEWVVSVDLTDAYFHIPIHQRSQNLLRFHVGGAFVPVQSTTLRHCDGSTRIHSCSQGGKVNASKQGYLHPPVFRRLAFASSNTADLHGAVKTTGRIRAGIRLGDQLQKIRVDTNSKIRFPGLQVRLGQGRGFAYSKKMANFEKCHRRSRQQCHNNSQDPNVFHRDPGSSREDSPNGQVAHEALPMVLENPLEVSPIIGQNHPMLTNFEKTSHMVERSKKCFDRVSPTCRGAQSPVVYRCFGQGLGSTFGRPDSQWTVVGQRDKFAYKHSGTKSSVSSNKVFSNPSFEQESLGGLRQFNSGGLPQQTGGGLIHWKCVSCYGVSWLFVIPEQFC